LLLDFVEPFLGGLSVTLGSHYVMPDFHDLVDELEFLQLIIFTPSHHLSEAPACWGLLSEK